MNGMDILTALNEADEKWVQKVGLQGGYLTETGEDPASPAWGKEAHPIREETGGQRRRRAFGLAAAAVLALATVSGSVWMLLGRGGKPVGATPIDSAAPGSQPALSSGAEEPTEFVWPEDARYPSAAELQLMEEMGLTLEDWYRIQQGDLDPASDNRPTSKIQGDPALEQALLGLKIGGLYLGQPQAEVLALYGEPKSRRVSVAVQTDGTYRDQWFYRVRQDENLLVYFVDAGEGFVVNQISTSARLEGEMPLGIQIGMPFDEAEAALDRDPVFSAVKVRRDYDRLREDGSGSMHGTMHVVLTDVNTGRPGILRLDISYQDQNKEGPHCVSHISLGQLYDEPPAEEPDPEWEEINRRFNSEEITVWLSEFEGWQGQTWRNEEAKVIQAQFSVSLPEPWDYDGSAPLAVIDFRNGYAAVLFDEAEHGAVYRVTDRAEWEASLTDGGSLRGLELWEYCRFPEGTLAACRDPYALAADWDFADYVGARYADLLATVREKGALLYAGESMPVALYREKGHYVIAGAFDGGEKITAAAKFREDHTLVRSTRDFPMIDLADPSALLGMSLARVRETCGAPAFTERRGGESCPVYITSSGYVVLLHTQENGPVTSLELYDHEARPMGVEAEGTWNDRWLYTPAADPCQTVREAISRQSEKVYTRSVSVEEVRIDETEKRKVLARDLTCEGALRDGFGTTLIAFAELASEDTAVVCARYTVEYDHTKTWVRDGHVDQYFYLVRNPEGNWEIFDSSSTQVVED